MVALHHRGRSATASTRAAEAARHSPTRPDRSRIRALVVVAAFVIGSAATLGVVSSVAPGASSASRGVVPDTILLQNWDDATQSMALSAFSPTSNLMQPILDGVSVGGAPLLSPDGSTLIVTGTQASGADLTTSVIALDAASQSVRWSVDVVVQPAATVNGQVAISSDVALAGDLVVVANHRNRSSDPIGLVAWSLSDGREAGRWEIPLNGTSVDGIYLRASPAGDRLTILTPLTSSAGTTARVAAIQLATPDMGEVWRSLPSDGSGGVIFWPYDSRVTADGLTLYDLSFFEGQRQEIHFFDLASGRSLPSVTVDLGESGWLYEHATSLDGNRLYILAPATARLAIVNLETRQLQEILDIDAGLVSHAGSSFLAGLWSTVRSWFVEEASAKTWFTGEMQFSPDGRLLYAAGLPREESSGEPRGVWVIDTQTWQVVDVWSDDFAPTQLLLDGSGRYLNLLRSTWLSPEGVADLVVLDAATGKEIARLDAGTATAAWSFTDLYRDRAGKAPDWKATTGAVAPAFKLQMPYARLSVSTDVAATIAGREVTVTARFLNPYTGLPMSSQTRDVRFSPPDEVTVTLSTGSRAEAITVPLVAIDYGVYSGSVRLSRPGAWTVEVASQRSGEPTRRAALDGVVAVQQALRGTDGRDYLISVSTEPVRPASEQPFSVHASLVDADTGTPLPEGVGISSGMPETIDLAFLLGGVTTATLRQDGHGSYAGEAHVFGAGIWTAHATFRTGDGVLVTMSAGSVTAQ